MGLIVVPALFLGLVIALIELFFVYQDEHGMGWLGHGLHAVPSTMFFTFVSMNVQWALDLFGRNVPAVTWQVELGVRVFIAVVAMIKISAAAAIVGRVGEKLGHTFVIGCLIFAAPYFWDKAGSALSNMLPFLKFQFAAK